MSIDLNMKVLIVDDYYSMRHILHNFLSDLKFNNIDEAPDGLTALEMLKIGKFDLVLCDWYMKPIDGLQLLKKIRADSSLKHIPFIMVTAESKTEKVIEAKEAGVSNYIIKPFNLPTLRMKLSTVLGEF